MSFYKKSLDHLFKMRTLMYFSVPLLIMAVIIAVNYGMNRRNYREMYQDFYFDYFDEMFRVNDERIQSAVAAVNWIVDSDFEKVFTASETPSDSDCVKVISRMNAMKNKNSFVDSMAILNKKADYVVATSGRSSVEKYFRELYRYDDYDLEFWRESIYVIDSVIKLPPTGVQAQDGSKYIMPIVITSPGNLQTNNLFILNIDITQMLRGNDTDKFTPNTSIFFVNKQTRRMYSANNYQVTDLQSGDVWNELVAEDQVRAEYKARDGEKYLMLAHTASPNLLEYAYLILVPLNDIYAKVNSNAFSIILITLFLFLVLIFITLFTANRINAPVSEIIGVLSLNNISDAGTFSEIIRRTKYEIVHMNEENKSLKSSMAGVMTEAKERRIIDIINNRNNQRLDGNIQLFRYNSFLAVLVKFSIPNDVDSTASKNYSLFFDEMYAVIQEYFAGRYDSYVIPDSIDDLRLILNLPDDVDEQTVVNELEQIEKIIYRRDDKIRLERYIGGIYRGIDGLKKTYENIKVNSTQITIADPEGLRGKSSILYERTDDNIIINNIISGNYQGAMDHIEKIMIRNILNDIESKNVKALYVNVVHAIITALKAKKINVGNMFNGRSDSEIYKNILTMTESQICGFILELFGIMQSNVDDVTNAGNIDSVMDYIRENYSDCRMSLDFVAEHFRTNAKYISNLLKKRGDMLFHEFLTDLRIEKAKELLLNTDMNIERIYTQIGYNSKTTFIRSFKAREGVTPSVYRQNGKPLS